MRLPFHFPLPAGQGPLYLAKHMGRRPAFVRGRVRGLVEWKIRIPEWSPYFLLGLLLIVFIFLGRSAGLRLHAAATRVEAAKPPVLSVHDSVRAAFDAARGYASAGRWNQAIASTNTAIQVLDGAKTQGLRMSSESFDSLMAGLDGIAVSGQGPLLQDSLMRARAALAEYRSALETAPLIPDDRTVLSAPRKLAPNSHTRIGDFLSVVDGSGLANGAEFLVPPSQVLASGVWVQDLTFVGGAQTLDGIHWRDVMFIRAHIRYQGGELELRNVRFVNCTFEIAKTGRGEEVTRYVTLDSPVLALD